MLSSAETERVLEEGKDEFLIGESETEHLDFKEQPHFLGTDKGKWELAKDVAAMANSGGGCIVGGVVTTVPPDREDEVASKIKPFPAEMADVQQIRAALDAAAGVYPVLKRVTIRRFSRPDGKAMLLIRVPPQDEDDLPFIVVRMVEGDEKRGIGIGMPFRSGPHTYWTPPGQLHRDLSDGRRTRQDSRNLTRISIQNAIPQVPVTDRTEERLVTIEQYMGWSEAPTLLLAAIPRTAQPIPIDGFYDPARIYGCVESPPEIRSAGFSVAWRSQPENVEGALVNATAERNVLWVDPDGASFAAATGLQSFLTRSGGSRTAEEPEPRIVNPTVLVEWTYLFMKFVHECIAPSVKGPLDLAARLRGAQSRPWRLQMAGGSRVEPWRDGRQAGLDDFYFEANASGDPGRDAFVVLVQIYAVFGIGPEQIPYTSDGHVDPVLIQAIA